MQFSACPRPPEVAEKLHAVNLGVSAKRVACALALAMFGSNDADRDWGYELLRGELSNDDSLFDELLEIAELC